MNTTELFNLTWDFLIEYEIATQDELELITCISGHNVETLNAVIYVRTAYHDLEQLTQCEYPEEYKQYFMDEEETEEE